jgi:predicted PurR-regulated permease PerM
LPRAPLAPRFTLDRVIRLGLGLGLVLVVAGLLWYFSDLVLYLLVGSVIAYLIRPVVHRIQGLGLGRIPAILTTFLLVFGTITLLVTFLVPFVAHQLSGLSQQVALSSSVQITEVVPGAATGVANLDPGDFIFGVDGRPVRSYNELQASLRNKRPGDAVTLEVAGEAGETRLLTLTLTGRDEAEAAPTNLLGHEQGRLLDVLGLRVRTVMFSDLLVSLEDRLDDFLPMQQGAFLNVVTSISDALVQEQRLTQVIGSMVGFFANVFYAVLVIPFVAFFALKDGARIRRGLMQLVPNRYFEITLALYEKIETNLGRYFRGLLIECSSVALVAGVLLSLVGLHYALAVAIFTGLANTIPYLGPLIGFVAGTLVGIAQTGDFSLVPGVLVAMALTRVADDVFFQPLIFSRAAQAHPLVILFVVLIGAQLAGILGMLLAIPVITIVRVTLQQILWSLRNYRILQSTR